MIAQNPSGNVLGLRYQRERGLCALQPLVAKLLVLIRDKTIEPKPSRERMQLRDRLESLCQALVTAENRKKAAELLEPILEVCDKLLDPPPMQPPNNSEVVAAIAL